MKKQPEQFELEQQHRFAATGTDTAAPAVAHDLRRLAAERLAAHRQRRNRLHTPEETTPQPAAPHNPIAAAVFERYSQSPSYRAVLAEQAQRAIQHAAHTAESAAAEAEVAARNAHAVAEAQQRLLAELQLWNAPQTFSPQTAQTFSNQQKPAQEPAPDPAPTQQKPVAKPAVTQPKHEDPWDWSTDSLPDLAPAAAPTAAPNPVPATAQHPPAVAPAPQASWYADPAPSELQLLEDEIAFRQAPVFEPFNLHPEPIAANLVEFPRQIVAPRKARPRLAEAPASDFTTFTPDLPQLRIFEAEPEAQTPAQTEAQTPAPYAAATILAPTPSWADLQLAAEPSTPNPVPVADDEILIRETIRSISYQEAFGEEPQIVAAPFPLRLMATAVDLILVSFSLLISLSITARIIQRLPTSLPAVLALAISFAILWPLYQLLFFSFSDQTPGMRFARIGFCGFNDEAPTRAAVRKRIFAQLIAVAPLGVGVFAALINGQGLGWHDRATKMYPRSY